MIADLRLGDDVSLGIPRLSGIPFHYVAEGECRLTLPTECVELTTGDFVMLPRWPDYRIETGRALERAEILDFAKSEGLPDDYLRTGVARPLLTTVGPGTTSVRLLSGIVSLSGRDDAPLTRDLPDITLVRNATSQLDPWLVAAIAFISAEGSTPQPGFAAIAERLVELIFVSVLRRWLLLSPRETGWMRGLTDPTTSRALDALHAEPARHWTLRDLAAASGRSRSGFAEHFNMIMQETPFAYLARLRMHLASGLVEQGHRSFADIAASLGYRSPRGFARAFLDVFGETPAQYRRHGRARQATTSRQCVS